MIASTESLTGPPAQSAETRRDFLYLTAGAMAVVGPAVAVWPLIDSMNPAADVRALRVRNKKTASFMRAGRSSSTRHGIRRVGC